MNNTNNGGQAFPCLERGGNGLLELTDGGMTLRDWFAGKAMQGMILLQSYRGTAADMAKESYVMADAMLKAREAI